MSNIKQELVETKFAIGAVVKHRFLDFRGVIFDVDPEFNNTEEWKKWCNWDPNDFGLKPPEIPASPHIYYKKSEWNGYNDWLGTENKRKSKSYRPFEDARKFAQELGLTSSEYWLRYCKGEFSHLPKKPNNIPTNVARKYRDIGWNGMNDFLNAKEHRRLRRLSNARDFQSARDFVHKLNLKNLKEWLRYIKGELPNQDPKPTDIPNSPELVPRFPHSLRKFPAESNF